MSPIAHKEKLSESFHMSTSEKRRNLSTINNIPLKCDCIDSSVLNGVRQSAPFSFL